MAVGGRGGRWEGAELGSLAGGPVPRGNPGLGVSQSSRVPPALPAGHPLPWSCLLGGCLHGGHPFIRWFSNLITSQNHWRPTTLLPSEVLSPWVWRGPDTQHFPGSCFSEDLLGDPLPWTTVSRGRSSVWVRLLVLSCLTRWADHQPHLCPQMRPCTQPAGPQGWLGPQSCGWRAACPATFLGTSPTRLPLLPVGPYSSPRPLLTPGATPDAAQVAFIQGKAVGVLMALN